MAYFSRLTDIVTCNLTELLREADDPLEALEQILTEMREGLAGAERAVGSAERSVQRIEGELAEHATQITYWTSRARAELAAGHEEEARQAIFRRREVEDLVAGLKQQKEAATATWTHLTTTLRALEARYSDAQRRAGELGQSAGTASGSSHSADTEAPRPDSRSQEVEDELASLKKELGLDG